jgi:hypothetical protein
MITVLLMAFTLSEPLSLFNLEEMNNKAKVICNSADMLSVAVKKHVQASKDVIKVKYSCETLRRKR